MSHRAVAPACSKRVGECDLRQNPCPLRCSRGKDTKIYWNVQEKGKNLFRNLPMWMISDRFVCLMILSFFILLPPVFWKAFQHFFEGLVISVRRPSCKKSVATRWCIGYCGGSVWMNSFCLLMGRLFRRQYSGNLEEQGADGEVDS